MRAGSVFTSLAGEILLVGLTLLGGLRLLSDPLSKLLVRVLLSPFKEVFNPFIPLFSPLRDVFSPLVRGLGRVQGTPLLSVVGRLLVEVGDSLLARLMFGSPLGKLVGSPFVSPVEIPLASVTGRPLLTETGSPLAMEAGRPLARDAVRPPLREVGKALARGEVSPLLREVMMPLESEVLRVELREAATPELRVEVTPLLREVVRVVDCVLLVILFVRRSESVFRDTTSLLLLMNTEERKRLIYVRQISTVIFQPYVIFKNYSNEVSGPSNIFTIICFLLLYHGSRL